jgi:hypothetical protein
MRIHFPTADRPKATAKWLKALSEKRVNGTQRMVLSKAQNATSTMLGYSDWHELEKVIGTQPPSPLDHEIPLEECRARRLFQAEQLKRIGFTHSAALAVVDIILPSGEFDHEMDACREHIGKAILEHRGESMPNPFEIERSWFRHVYGVDDAFADRVAKARTALGEPLTDALKRWTKRTTARASANSDGYGAVIYEDGLYWQAVFLKPLPPEMKPMAERVERELRAELSRQTSGPDGMIRYLEAMAAGNFVSMPYTYQGSLHAAFATTVLEHQIDAGVNIIGNLIREESGDDFFIIFVRSRTEKGMATTYQKLDVGSADEARTAINNLPEVKRIKEVITKRANLPQMPDDA